MGPSPIQYDWYPHKRGHVDADILPQAKQKVEKRPGTDPSPALLEGNITPLLPPEL